MLTSHGGSDMQQEAICLRFHWRVTKVEQETRDSNKEAADANHGNLKGNIMNFTVEKNISLFPPPFCQFLQSEIKKNKNLE